MTIAATEHPISEAKQRRNDTYQCITPPPLHNAPSIGSPVSGSNSSGSNRGRRKSKALTREPANSSKEPLPIWPRFQLSSINRIGARVARSMVDEISSGIERNDEQRNSRSMAASILISGERRIRSA